jgi:transposase-like protein
MADTLAAAHFRDDASARKLIESVRWPNGPVCSHCGSVGHAYATKKPGWYRCAEKACRKDFTVTTGTVMERSHIPLHKWLIAFYMLNSSKKGISAHQLHRTLGIRYQSAWFMCHRIREAMRSGGLMPPIGGEGKIVEADETYFGTINKDELMPRVPGKQGRGRKAGIRRSAYRAVLALVERGGQARTFHVAQADQNTVSHLMATNIAKESRIHTDESHLYKIAPWRFSKHETIKHSAKEYARGDVTTNTVEGYFSIFKRGMKGIYQHCGEQHLHRYLAEFDHRYNHRAGLGFNDTDRTIAAIKGVGGKRLTYRQPH